MDFVDFFNNLPNKNIIDQVINHLPAEDLDNDSFSEFKTLRGSNWRGKDCNDLNKHVHPGRKTWESNIFKGRDFNCNGISGFHSVD